MLGDLPRISVGPCLAELDPALDKSLERLRSDDCEMVIADLDQDGAIASRFGKIEGVPTISRTDFLPRSGCGVRLVDLNGRIGIRKEFGTRRGRFVQELEALIALERFGCPVPRVMNVDWDEQSITMTFIRGQPVRELLALAGAKIRDRDDPRPYSRSIDRERIRAGRAQLAKVLSRSQIDAVAAALASIHEAGFAIEDVKFGNIIIEEGTGKPFFVDLERALPTSSLPRPLAAYLHDIDLRKFDEHFTTPDEDRGGRA